MPDPYDFARDDARRRVRIAVRQPLEASDLSAIIDRQLAEGAWQYGMLYDLRAPSTGPTSSKDVQELGEYVRAHIPTHGPRGPVALVTRRTDMIAAGQIYALGARGYAVEIFWDLDEAERWLDEHQFQK